MIHPREVHAARARRHHLTPSTVGRTDADYLRILRALGPLRPPAYAHPGTPALLPDRHAAADPVAAAQRVRREGRVFKGRFQHGRLAYVASDEIGLHLRAFSRPARPGGTEERVLETLGREGPLLRADLAELARVERKVLNATLERLQRAGLVFEDQTETVWDNPWGLVETERPGALDEAPSPREARLTVLGRFANALVFTTEQEAAGWSGWPARECRALLDELVARRELVRATVHGWGEHYLAADFEPVALEPCVAILDPGDPLFTAQAARLKAGFPGLPVLKAILLDGEVVGVVEGRWGIAAFDVDDVHLPDTPRSREARDEIVAKLRRDFPPPAQRILRYRGEPLDRPPPLPMSTTRQTVSEE